MIKSLDLLAATQELRKEREKALEIARQNIINAQLEYEKIIAYYNQILI